ncbi:NUDIX domain-containing protein [bacterium]|nr:NUDIX domain-containing protein [bacterium]
MVSKFNIRVYGIWVKNQKILLSHENIDGFKMTKFPGGGLEFEEGLIDGLKREYKEELNLDIDIVRHLHTTEDFIQSRFRPEEQVIAVYYQINSEIDVFEKEIIQDTRVGKENRIRFEWKDAFDGALDLLSFEADKVAMSKLLPLI